MSLQTPFRRTVRIFADGTYSEGGKWQYVRHKDYAKAPENFIRAFLLIQKDLLSLFECVEPSATNEATYSHRMHELLPRACVEVEANCTAILTENGYSRTGNWNIAADYSKLEQSHYLSRYQIKVPYWTGANAVRSPFLAWASASPRLGWYQAYNQTKHDRHLNFAEANFKVLIDAVAGLAALLASQFLHHDFSPAGTGLAVSLGGPSDGFEAGVGDFFRVKFPDQASVSDPYDFKYSDIDFNHDMFQNFTYT